MNLGGPPPPIIQTTAPPNPNLAMGIGNPYVSPQLHQPLPGHAGMQMLRTTMHNYYQAPAPLYYGGPYIPYQPPQQLPIPIPVHATMSSGMRKRPKRKRRSKSPGAPKQPGSGFVHFSRKTRHLVRHKVVSNTRGEVMKLLAEIWNNQMTDEEKEPYIEMSNADKARYKKEIGIYRANKEERAQAARQEQKRPRIQPPQKQTTTEGESSSSIQPSSTPLQQQPTIPPQQKHELKAQVISSSSTLHTSSMGVTLQDPAQLLNATTQAAPAAAIQHVQPNAPRLL